MTGINWRDAKTQMPTVNSIIDGIVAVKEELEALNNEG